MLFLLAATPKHMRGETFFLLSHVSLPDEVQKKIYLLIMDLTRAACIYIASHFTSSSDICKSLKHLPIINIRGSFSHILKYPIKGPPLVFPNICLPH